MRWGDNPIRFARPIHWILALFGGEVVPFEVGNIRSENRTYGHRFMHSGPIPVKDFQSYLQKTREALCHRRSCRTKEKDWGGDDSRRGQGFRENPSGWRAPRWGQFSGGVPSGPLRKLWQSISFPSSRGAHPFHEGHQEVFPLVDDRGILLPHFVCISNIHPKNREVVVKGNEKVLRARLSDAAFFFEDDLKNFSGEKNRAVEEGRFPAKLGTSYEEGDAF